MPPDPAKSAAASSWRAALLGLLVIAGVAIVYISPVRGLLSSTGIDGLRSWLAGTGSWAPAAFLVLTAAGVAIGAPRLLFAAVAGLSFGWLPGSLLALLGTVAGCLVTFGYARTLGRPWLQARRGARLERVNNAFRDHGILVNLAIRAAPVGNCHVANLLMAVSPISLRDFVLGTLLGTLPETVIYALFASAAAQGTLRAGLAHAVGGGVLLLVLGTSHLVMMRRSAVARNVVSALSGEGSRGHHRNPLEESHP